MAEQSFIFMVWNGHPLTEDGDLSPGGEAAAEQIRTKLLKLEKELGRLLILTSDAPEQRLTAERIAPDGIEPIIHPFIRTVGWFPDLLESTNRLFDVVLPKGIPPDRTLAMVAPPPLPEAMREKSEDEKDKRAHPIGSGIFPRPLHWENPNYNRKLAKHYREAKIL